jgi:thiosulfate/3-mercaptopyruvate sulfurtransferase
MLVSVDWLKDNFYDQDLIISDTRPKTLFLYDHLAKYQSLAIDQIIQFDQYGLHLVIDPEKVIELFSSFGIDDSKIVLVIGESMDLIAARIV